MNDKSTLLNKIAVVQMWPEVKAAEDEVIARLVKTCEPLGIEVVLVNTAGKLVGWPHTKVTSKDVDFVLHLHFETPKTYDAFSFVALWNPLEFYFKWGYRVHSNNLLTHDDFISCDSPGANDHVKRLLVPDRTHLPPYFTLFHSLSTPILEPTLGKQKLFYVGINWDKLGKPNGRHHHLLQVLDKTNNLVIYGPEVFQNVRVWEGYQSYAGSLPFDGQSVIHAIHEAGITLVLSSEAHLESELMSSRLFEGVAAGSVIIADENAFAKKHFGDTLLYIRTQGMSPGKITQQVQKHLEWIEQHPDEALELARSAQEIFKAKFDMAISVKRIFEELPRRKAEIANVYLHRTDEKSLTIIGFIFRFGMEKLANIISNFEKQTYPRKRLILILDRQDYATNKMAIDSFCRDKTGLTLMPLEVALRDENNTTLGNVKIGRLVSQVLADLPVGELVSLLPGNEQLFSEHYSSLVRAFENDPNLDLAYTNVLLEHFEPSENKTFFDLRSKVVPFNRHYNEPNGYSRFMFRVTREAWSEATLRHLDWGLMDAIYCKARNRTKVNRASSMVDIKALSYSVTDLDQLQRDCTLMLDSMDDREEKAFAAEYHEVEKMEAATGRKINLVDYSITERKAMISYLIDALELPGWIRNGVRGLHRLKNRWGKK